MNKIIQGDCLKVMRQMPDKCIDLVLTDPPYGINFEYDIYSDSPHELQKIVNAIMPEIERISHRALITFGITNVFRYPEPKWMLCWYYGTTNTRGPWGFNSWQPILAYGNDAYLANGLGARMDIIKDSHTPEKNGHPCPKSIQFWKQLLLRGSVKVTDIIFDPFMGSGTTAVACKELGRNFIGVEISEKYCQIARDRVDTCERQPEMFKPSEIIQGNML